VSDRRVAVVDVGSNSTRLFLCDGIDEDGPHGERITTITSLRRGAGTDGSVAADALGRLDDCLTDFGARIASFGTNEVIAVGTSAVRDAPNRDRIEAVVRERLGTELRVLAGAQEAELAYVGARLAISGGGPVLVVDIGGGSTELIRGDEHGPTSAVSLDMGGVRFTETFLHSDPPTDAQVLALRDEVAGLVIPALAALGGSAPVVGVAGTMTTIAAIALGRYDSDQVHGMILSAEDVQEITEHLRSLPLDARRTVPGLHPDRAPFIVAGALIASTVLAAAGVGGVAISERDLLDGAVMQLVSDAG
jgi:exopolyphosphatase/guanosine-5'-triphosphate,3'-diphosphate pyrophosphatase